MATVFRVSLPEMLFLQGFAETLPLPWNTGPQHLGETEIRLCAESLEKKQYLLKSMDGEYELAEALDFLIRISAQASRFLVLEGVGFKEAVYFEGDAIALFQQDMEGVDIVWIPVLPLLIGQFASVLSPFLNQQSDIPEKHPIEEYDLLRAGYEQNGFQQQWKFSSYDSLSAYNERQCALFTNGKEQIMFLPHKSTVELWKPCKADCINTLTAIFAPMHGQAIQEGGNLYGGI